MAQDKSRRAQALAALRKSIKPGSTLWTSVWRGTRGGGEIGCHVEPAQEDVSLSIALVLDLEIGKRGGVLVGDMGMDAGFYIANRLSYELHGWKSKGDKAIEADKEGRPFVPKRRQFRAGYSINHRWL